MERLPRLARTAVFGLVALLLTPSLWAQRELKVIPDPDPELERKSFQVADGFEVNLYAADPLLAKPIQMNFDAAGRLWVASSSVYPQIEPGQAASDKILVLEDTNQDGTADKTTVFVDGLLIPTGIEPGDGGAYVANSTELIHFRDTNGDLKADERRIMLSGFGTEDTHHIVHTFRWGHDGMLYFNQSIYIHSHIETPHGVRRLNGGGIWQFRPETLDLNVFARGLVNTWGHHIDRWGQSFATDGAGGEGINYVFPGVSFLTVVGVPRIMPGLNPGSPKYCGLEIVSGRHLPDDWQGSLITNDFRGHRVVRFVLTESNSGYVSREQPELIKTSHAAFRPIDVKMGPDGAIYIADWYNPIIQHGEVDFRDPRRDHVHGRIWRVTAKGRDLAPRPQLVGAPVADLLDSLKVPEGFTRQQAQRQLKERGAAEVLPVLATWVQQLDREDPEFEHHRLEGLWMYQALNVAEPELLRAVLQSPEPRARAAAVRIVPFWASRLENPLPLLAERVLDEHPQVRLEAVRALGQFPSTRAAELAMQVLDRPMDKNIDYAAWLTARELQPVWLPALQAGEFNFSGNVRHLTFALQASGVPGVVKPLLDSLQNGQIPADRRGAIFELVAGLGSPEELDVLFQYARTEKSPLLLDQLAQAARLRNIKPAGDLSQLGELLTADDPAVQSSAARLAGLWKLEALRPALIALAQAEQTSLPVRQAALAGLAGLGGEESIALLKTIAQGNPVLALRVSAAADLATVDPATAVPLSLELLPLAGPDVDVTRPLSVLLEQVGGAEALKAALQEAQLSEDSAKLALRTVRNSLRDDPDLITAIQKAGKLSMGPQELTPAQMQQLVAEVLDQGQAAHGEMLFRRNDLNCYQCHAIGGAGGRVGPDLISIGASAQVDYLVDSLLQPSKQIKENYHSLVVVNDQGRIFTGIQVGKSDRELVLRTSQDEDVAIPLDSIDEQVAGKSLMPPGLVDGLTRTELRDLVRFLSELGKVGGDYTIGKARVIRRWRMLRPDQAGVDRLKLLTLPEIVAAPQAGAWQPRYSLVNGSLPLNEVPGVEIRGGERLRLLQAEFEVSQPGVVQWKLDCDAPSQAFIDGTPVDLAAPLELSAGVHRLTLATAAGSAAMLRLELQDVPGSTAQVQIVSGK